MTVHLQTASQNELKPRIAVIGVGGAGGNAVNNMIAAQLQGVSFIVANTDAQALACSRAETTLQLGVAMTEGLGAGSKPEIGAAAAEESIEEIKAHLRGQHMVFITAGMGGGTGTGAAPVIAKAAREEGVLAVGVVTKPFHFEGQRRMRQAEFGIQLLAEHVDTLITIPNQNLFKVAVVKTTFSEAFAMADQVLHDGISCITDVMVKGGIINLDFADVNLVMRGMGKAMMGTGEASGENRGRDAAEAAITNPLLEDVTLQGARGLLVSIIGAEQDLTLYEVDEAANRVREEVDSDANIIVGTAFDDSLDGCIRVSVVATGLDKSGAVEAAPPVQPTAEVLQSAQEVQPAQPAPAARQAQPAPAQEVQPAPQTQPAQQAVQPQAAPQSAPQPQAAPQATPQAVPQAQPMQQPQAVPQAAPQAQQPVAGVYEEEGQAYGQYQPQPAGAEERTRMPRLEDFPPVGQTILRNQMNGGDEQGGGQNGVRNARKGLFERLASLNTGRDSEKSAVQVAPTVAPQQRQPKQSAPVEPQGGYAMMDPHLKGGALSTPQPGRMADHDGIGEDIEFPEFLRNSGS